MSSYVATVEGVVIVIASIAGAAFGSTLSSQAANADTDALQQKIIHLEQQVIDLGLQVAERDEDLAAARATNREFMARLNAPHPTR